MAKQNSSGMKFVVVGLIALIFILAAALLISFSKKSTCGNVSKEKDVNKIDFADTFKSIYDRQTRKRGWETYISLVNGFAINYPKLYRVTSDCPEPEPDCLSINFSYNSDKNVMYDDALRLYLARTSGLSKNNSLMDIAKANSTYSIENQDVATFETKIINSNEVVIADFVMTQKLYDSEKALNTYRNRQTAMEPVGFHRKTAFIKHGDRIYILKSGSLFEPYQEEVFGTMLQSLTFIVL